MALPTSSSFLPSVNSNPFSDFINPNVNTATGGPSVLNFEKLAPSADITQRLLCGFQFGAYTAPTPVAGPTGCGLGAILEFIDFVNSDTYLSGVVTPISYNDDFFKYTTFFVRTPDALVAALNTLHNNINEYLWYLDPANTASTGRPVSTRNTNIFNFYSKYLFPGSYNSANYSTNDDKIGGGIVNAFIISDSGSYPNWTLSRAGYEFYTLLNYLSYGGMAAVSTNGWQTLTTITDFKGSSVPLTNVIVPTDVYIRLDALATLEMTSYLDGQGITAAATNNQAVYAGATYSYASGNTFNITQGVTASILNNTYANTVGRNNLLNAFLDVDAPRYGRTSNAIIIHAGLSGANFSVAQTTTSGDFTDVYRYPGFDGRSSFYQNIQNISGLTAYVLTADPYLNRTFCIMGKKQKTIYSENFGDPNNNYFLTIDLPLVSDVAGLLNVAKQNGAFYGPITGGSGKFLNCDSVTPNITANSAQATTLKQKRINFASSTPSGICLGSDLVGVTGSYTINNRYGISSLNRIIKTRAEGILQTLIDAQSTSYNNAFTRQTAVSRLTDMVSEYASTYFRMNDPALPSAPGGYTVVCDSTNGNVDGGAILYATITYYPKAPASGGVNLSGISVTVSAVGDV